MKTYDFIPDGITVKARPRDLRNQRFAYLVAIECVGKHASGSLLWRCVCDCGREHVAKGSSLVSEKRHSCGCARSKAKSAWHISNVTWNKGKTYQIKADDEHFKSKKSFTDAAIAKFGNRCQVCDWSAARCDVHHRIPRRLGGLNTMSNAVVLCPNCHRIEHERGDPS